MEAERARYVMSEGRDRTKWMSLEEIHDHFKLHGRQIQLLAKGLQRINPEGPAFIVLHTGAALYADGKESNEKLIAAVSEQIVRYKEQADNALSHANDWTRILERIQSMDDSEDQWRNPLWEIEISKKLRKEIKSRRNIHDRPFRKSTQPLSKRFRRGLKYRDVVCIHKGQCSAFVVDRSDIGELLSLKGHWNPLFPDVNFERNTFRWMVFPKDISGNATTSYLQFGTMAGPKAGNGNVQRFDFREGEWEEGEFVESWVS